MSEPDCGGGARRWLFGLTADEWLHLAAEGEDSEVAPCCANISDLRECLNELATSQERERMWIRPLAFRIRQAHETCADTHDLEPARFPLLHRVLAGLTELVPDAFGDEAERDR